MKALLVTILCVLTPLSHGQGWQTPGSKGNDPASVIIAIPPPPGVQSPKNRILVLPSSNSIVRWAGDSRGAVAVDQPGTSIVRPTGNPVQLKDAFAARPSTYWASGQNPVQGPPNISRGKIPVFWQQSSVVQNGKRPGSIDLPNERIVTSDQSGSPGNPPDGGNTEQQSRATQQQQSTQQQSSQNGPQKTGKNPTEQGQQNSAQQQQSINTAQRNTGRQEGSQTRNQPPDNTDQQQGWRNAGVQRPGDTQSRQWEMRNTRVVNKPTTQPPTRVNSGSIFFNPDSPTNGPAMNPEGPSVRPVARNTGSGNRPTVQTVAQTPTVVRNRPGFVPAAPVFVPQQTGSLNNQQTPASSKLNNNNQPPSRSISQTDGQAEIPPPAPVDAPVIRSRPNGVMSGKIEYTGNSNAASAPSVAVGRGSRTGKQQTNSNQQPQPDPEPQPTYPNSPTSGVSNQQGPRAGPNTPRPIYGNGGRPNNQNSRPEPDWRIWNQAANQAVRPGEQLSPNRAGNQRYGAAPFPQVPATGQGQVNPNLRPSRPNGQINPSPPNTADSPGKQNPQQSVVRLPNSFTANNNAGNPATGVPGRQQSAVNRNQPGFPQMNPEINPNQAQLNPNNYPQNTPDTFGQPISSPNSFHAGMDIQLILNRIASQYEQARRNQLRGSSTNPISSHGGNGGVATQNPNGMAGINLLGQRNDVGSVDGNTPPVNPNHRRPISRSGGNLPNPEGQQFPQLFPRQQSNFPGSQGSPGQAFPPQWTARPITPNRQTTSPNSQRTTGVTFRPNSQSGAGLSPNSLNGPMFGQSWPVDAAGNAAQQPGFFPNQPAGRNGMILPALPANPSEPNILTTTPEPTEAPEIEVEPTPRPTPIPNIWQRLGLRPNSQATSGSGQAQPGGLNNVPFWNNRQQTPVPGGERTTQPRANPFFPQAPFPGYRQGFRPLGSGGETSFRNNVPQNQPFPVATPVDSWQFRNRNANGAPNQAGPLTNFGVGSSTQNQLNRQPQNPSQRNYANQPNNNEGSSPGRVQPAWIPPTQTGAGQRPFGQIGAGQRPPSQTNTGQRPPSQTSAGQRPPSQTGSGQRRPSQTGAGQIPLNQSTAGQREQTQAPNTPNQQNTQSKPPVRSTPKNPKIQPAWVPPSRNRVPQIQPPLSGTARSRSSGQQINRGNNGGQQRGEQSQSNSSTGVNPTGQTQNPVNPMFPGMNPSLLALLNQQRNSQSGGANPTFPGMPNGMPPQMMGMALLRRFQDRILLASTCISDH